LAESIGGNQAAKRLGIPDSSLWNWLRLSRAGKLKGADPSAVPVRRAPTELEAENARLRRELAETKLDLEIVKNVWSVPVLQALIVLEQKNVCVNVSGLLVQREAASLDGIRAHRAP
jgi:transposase